MDEFVLAVTLLLVALGGLLCGYAGYFGQRRLKGRVSQLEQELNALRQHVLSLAAGNKIAATPERGRADKTSPAAELPPTAPLSTPAPAVAKPRAASYSSVPTRPELAQSPAWLTFIQTHWMILIGGFSLALAGIFLIRYSVESGLLSPAIRVGAAVLFGCGLIGLASWLKVYREDGRIHAACAGAGALILYAATLASGALYGWLPPGWVFGLLALISALSMGLALRHGPVLAALGVLGAFIVPLLVSTGSNNMAAALGYALIVAAGGFALLRFVYRDWLWWGVWGGALAWLLLSLMEPTQLSGWRSLYLTALAWLGFALPLFGWRLQPGATLSSHSAALRQSLLVVWAALAFCQWAILEVESVTVWLFPGAAGLWLLALLLSRHEIRHARWWPLLTLLPPILNLLALSSPSILKPLLPAVQHTGYLVMAGLFSVLAVVLAGRLGWRRQQAGWMALATGVPLLMAVLVDLRLAHQVGGYLPVWLFVGLTLLSGMTLWIWLRRQMHSDAVSAVLILALQGAISLALIAALKELRLTLGLSAQWLTLVALLRYVPDQSWSIKGLRWQGNPLDLVARALLLAVVLRLTLNPWLPEYGASGEALLLTYLGCFLLALTTLLLLYRRPGPRALRLSFEAGTLQLFALAVAACTRYQLYDGQIFKAEFGWLEAGIYVMTLLAGSAAYRYRCERTPSRLLGGLAEIQLLLGLGLYLLFALLRNPLWTEQAVGTTPLWNVLLLIYGAPALLLVAQALLRRDRWREPIIGLAGASALLFLILQIRHLWHGGLLPHQPVLVGELYSYSVLGLMVGIGLLLTAARWHLALVQKLGTAALLLVILKIFFWDMAGLDGLWRVASFLGLGITLLGVAYLHNRLQIPVSGQGQQGA
ncbi:DUF2339 domain-containing protein [Ferrimonas pelagia]|uniref:DUF2339 domain-containing protein n=1 Tax=Ferrimonas pelagia TaxID=1177826 RepID=A0ABP9F6J2_9GAMM